jgi:YVTN family beta-propeller protein
MAFVLAANHRDLCPLDLSSLAHPGLSEDGQSRRAEAAIQVGEWPDAIVLVKNGRQAYVANIGSSSISQLNLIQRKVVGSVRIAGAFEMAVAAAGRRLYVTGSGGDEVSVIDTTRFLRAFKVVSGRRPWGIDATSSGRLVYVTNWRTAP